MSTHWSKRAEIGSLMGMRFLYGVHRRLGPWPFQIILLPVVLYFFLTQKIRRAESSRYLNRLHAYAKLGKPARFMVFRHFFVLGQGILDRILAWDPRTPTPSCTRHGREAVSHLLEQGRGVLLIGSHLGNLEVARKMSLTERNVRVNVLVHTRHNPRYIDFMRRINPSSQTSLYQVSEINPATAIELKSKIDAGEVVLIAGDRIPTDGKGITWAPFLGHPAPWAIGPYVLASLLECPVFLFFCLEKKGGYELFYEPFAEKVVFDRETRREELARLAGKFSERLENYCVKAPLQWGNIYDFWNNPDLGKH